MNIRTAARASSSLKSDDSPVTEADLAADAIIREGLSSLGDAIITEETWKSGDVGEHHRAWFIDPIDGTEDFIAGTQDYVVQIGFCVDGVPALGVLFQPATGLLWRGVVGDGRCERMDPDGTVHPRVVGARPLDEKPRVAVSISHPSPVVDFIVHELGGVAIPKGSVGLKVGLIVDNDADAYVTASRRVKVWDTCAPAAVLLAAGGDVTSLTGKALRYTGPAPHDDGVCMWTPAARRALEGKVNDAIARYRAGHTP